MALVERRALFLLGKELTEQTLFLALLPQLVAAEAAGLQTGKMGGLEVAAHLQIRQLYIQEAQGYLAKVSVAETGIKTVAALEVAAQVLLALTPQIQVFLTLKTVMQGARGLLPIVFPVFLRNMLVVAVLAAW